MLMICIKVYTLREVGNPCKIINVVIYGYFCKWSVQPWCDAKAVAR